MLLFVSQTPKSSETPKVVTTDYGYLRLRREDYAESDVERWTRFVRVARHSNWLETFSFISEHAEAGIGPKPASRMVGNC